MKIAIDGYEANELKRVGIGEYAYQILIHLYGITTERNELNITVYLPDTPASDLPEETSKWQYKVKHPKRLWTFGALPISLITSRPDVVFSPTHYIPRFVQFPRVMSIMDLSFLSFPELFRQKDYYQLVNWTEYSVKHAKAICTISEFSKNAIIKQYNYPSERVFVTYPGITKVKNMSETTVNLQSKYSLQNRFILSVGTLQPRKNFERVIEAFSILKKNTVYADIDLVIAGKRGWLYEGILEAPEKFGVKESVKFLDFVNDEDLPSLYRQAECFVLASLYEGFGLPVLEAMANSCMVVVSNVSSLPEIAGDAGIYVEPESIQSIVHGMQTALDEKKTPKAENRIKTGQNRVKLFNWHTAAEQTLNILETVGNKKL